MPDGSIVSTGMRWGTRKGLLFPVAPQPGETLLGYVVRALEPNHLGTPASFLTKAGINLGIRGDYLSRLGENLNALADLLGVDPSALKALWGAEPLSNSGKRRLGGVHLRPHLVYHARRRFLPSHPPGEPDRPTWMVRPLNFCPDSWEILVDRCPPNGCGLPLSWPSAKALHRCNRCGTPLAKWKTRTVARKDRAALAWIVQLFSDDESNQQTAVSRVPPFFEIHSPTDAFEMALAFGQAAHLQREPGNARSDWRPADLAAGVRLLLDYPRSIWDLYRDRARREQPPLLTHLLRIARDHSDATVTSNVQRLIFEHRLTQQAGDRRSVTTAAFLSLTAAGQMLGVERAKVLELVESGHLTSIAGCVRGQLKVKVPWSEVQTLLGSVRQSMTWADFQRSLNVPAIAIEQLAAMSWLFADTNPVVRLVRGSKVLRGAEANEIMRALLALPAANRSSSYIALADAFRGVGGREKPWGPILTAGLKGTFPGGLRWLTSWKKPRLAVDARIARAFVMGGPEFQSAYAFHPDHYGREMRPWIEPYEVETYLNCTAQDVCWLRSRGDLTPQPKAERTRYERAAVEALGRRFMSSREAAARLGLLAKDVWELLEAYPGVETIGQGFHDRLALEQVLRTEAPKLTWWT